MNRWGVNPWGVVVWCLAIVFCVFASHAADPHAYEEPTHTVLPASSHQDLSEEHATEPHPGEPAADSHPENPADTQHTTDATTHAAPSHSATPATHGQHATPEAHATVDQAQHGVGTHEAHQDGAHETGQHETLPDIQPQFASHYESVDASHEAFDDQPEYHLTIRRDHEQSTEEQPIYLVKMIETYERLSMDEISDVLLWWTDPEGHQMTFRIRPVDEGNWASLIDPGNSVGTHELSLLIMYRDFNQEDGRLVRRNYQLILPDLILVEDDMVHMVPETSAHQLVDIHEGEGEVAGHEQKHLEEAGLKDEDELVPQSKFSWPMLVLLLVLGHLALGTVAGGLLVVQRFLPASLKSGEGAPHSSAKDPGFTNVIKMFVSVGMLDGEHLAMPYKRASQTPSTAGSQSDADASEKTEAAIKEEEIEPKQSEQVAELTDDELEAALDEEDATFDQSSSQQSESFENEQTQLLESEAPDDKLDNTKIRELEKEAEAFDEEAPEDEENPLINEKPETSLEKELMDLLQETHSLGDPELNIDIPEPEPSEQQTHAEDVEKDVEESLESGLDTLMEEMQQEESSPQSAASETAEPEEPYDSDNLAADLEALLGDSPAPEQEKKSLAREDQKDLANSPDEPATSKEEASTYDASNLAGDLEALLSGQPLPSDQKQAEAPQAEAASEQMGNDDIASMFAKPEPATEEPETDDEDYDTDNLSGDLKSLLGEISQSEANEASAETAEEPEAAETMDNDDIASMFAKPEPSATEPEPAAAEPEASTGQQVSNDDIASMFAKPELPAAQPEPKQASKAVSNDMIAQILAENPVDMNNLPEPPVAVAPPREDNPEDLVPVDNDMILQILAEQQSKKQAAAVMTEEEDISSANDDNALQSEQPEQEALAPEDEKPKSNVSLQDVSQIRNQTPVKPTTEDADSQSSEELLMSLEKTIERLSSRSENKTKDKSSVS